MRPSVSVPLPLALLVAVALVLMMAWAVAQPPWQGPDESAHFAYTQRIVEQQEIPWYRAEPTDEPLGGSGELNTALRDSGLRALQGNLAMKDVAREVDEDLWREADARLDDDERANTGFTSTMLNPPLYYAYEAIPYAATSQLGIFTRAFAMRLANVPLVIAVVVATWLLAGLLAGPRPSLQVLATGVAALNAQFISVAATVNADALLAALYAVAFVLMGLILLRSPTRGRVGALVAVAAAAGLTHGRGLALLMPVALTLAIAWWRARGPRGPRARRWAVLAAGGSVAVGTAVVMFAATRGSLELARMREFLSYVWQFYLPRLGFMEPAPRSDWDVRDVFVDRFWGTFAQLDAVTQTWVVDLMSTTSKIGVLALIVVLVVRRRTTARTAAFGAVLLLALGGYLLALHVGAYRSLSAGSTDPVLTGRYLIPFVGLLGVAVAVAVSWLPRRAVPVVASAVLFASLALHFAALGALLVRFHG